MIDRQQIMKFSREFGLAQHVIEKDYMLGWLLAGISQHAKLSESWAFKGGHALRSAILKPTLSLKTWTPF